MSNQSVQLDVNTLRNFVPFTSLSEMHLKDVMKRAKAMRFPTGKMIFKRGDASNKCFYLLSGSVDLCDQAFNIHNIKANDEKARFALDNTTPHQYSAVTTEDVLVLVVDKDHLDLVLTWDQAGNYLVTDLGQEESPENDWMSALLQSHLFTQIPPANIQQLFNTFQRETVSAGELVIEQGEIGDRFYVIERGSAEVLRREGDGEEVLAILGPGRFFGEEALIGDTTRNASVRMTTNGSLMYLEKDQFTELLQQPVLEFATPEEVEAAIAQGTDVTFVDVRTENELAEDQRPNTLNLPLATLRDHFESLNPDTHYVIISDGSRRSQAGAYLLTEAGFNAVVLKE